MKTPTRLMSLVTVSLLSAALLASCSKGDEYNKSVDVKAMTAQLKSPD